MKRKGKPPFIIYRGKFCKGCVVKEECTTGPARRITRDGRESLVEAMREKLRSEGGKRNLQETPLYGRAGHRKYEMEL